ncbi:NADH-ubiquinone oxidoreductase [Actinidia chinensis var. chinensis]|uniref:NADH-ubiquinone oxidoreductase n=1 Tax=Actinidia chinensis var. chinensis TaxID=1590841 RepID=A0A2R6PDW5_ACTCC|nr:NADH-ubiquinone oxidoreductase [Actinidia chinensis var. chinensis]
MAAYHAPPPEDTSIQISLINVPPHSDDTHLDKHLRRLESFLRFFGFCQYSPLNITISWLAFLAIGVVMPLLILEYSYCSDCEKFEIRVFEVEVLVAQAILAAISLLCVSHNLRKYRVRRLLFVDRYRGHVAQFRDLYIQKIQGFFRVLAVWILPCFLLKVAREVVRSIYVRHGPWWQSIGVVIALLVSWTYLTVIFLSGTALFNLVCNLQVIHFESFGKLLERDLDVSIYIDEHIRLRHYLSKISHRFRIFLLLEFLGVTVSLLVALLQTTGNHGILNLINGGDFGVSSIIDLVGIILCLHAAAKITHRAQGIASVASSWHVYVTCNSNGASQAGTTTNGGNFEAGNSTGALPTYSSESDLESTEYVPMPTNTQLASYMSSYHKRQSFVTYLQTNPGGFTVFGWVIDRILVNTIFFIEFSLFSFILGKTITITTR